MFRLLLAFTCLLATGSISFADGFDLHWAIQNSPHVVLKLSEEQADLVGRERKLVLTNRQQESLSRIAEVKVPGMFGVESLGEADCGCCISTALWTGSDEVTIWTNRLKGDKKGSSYYHEVRMKPGHYTADADGHIYAAGKRVPWDTFESMVLKRKKGEFFQLALPPSPPSWFTKRLNKLSARSSVSHRL